MAWIPHLIRVFCIPKVFTAAWVCTTVLSLSVLLESFWLFWSRPRSDLLHHSSSPHSGLRAHEARISLERPLMMFGLCWIGEFSRWAFPERSVLQQTDRVALLWKILTNVCPDISTHLWMWDAEGCSQGSSWSQLQKIFLWPQICHVGVHSLWQDSRRDGRSIHGWEGWE